MSCNFLDIGWVSVVDVSTTRQVLCLYIGWCWSIVVLHMADVIAILFVADVITTVMYFIGRCYCHILVGWCYCHSWYITRQMLLPMWLLLLPLVGMMYHSMADVIVIFVGWCHFHACVLLYFVADVITTMADGIAICENDVIGRCYCQGGRWNSLPGWMCGQVL